MKYSFAILLAIAAFAVVSCEEDGPMKISSNNVGDIVSVGVDLGLKLENKIDQNIISVIIALLNQQAVGKPKNPEQTPPDNNRPEI